MTIEQFAKAEGFVNAIKQTEKELERLKNAKENTHTVRLDLPQCTHVVGHRLASKILTLAVAELEEKIQNYKHSLSLI